MLKKSLFALTLISALTITACASNPTPPDDDTTNTATNTQETEQVAPASDDIAGIPAATKVSALDKDQSALFCTALGESLVASQEGEEMKRSACLIGGLMMASFAGADEEKAVAAACHEAYDECMAQEEEEIPAPEICPGSEKMASCEATVGEIDACLTGMIDHGFGALRELSESTCQELATEEGGARVQAAMARMNELGGGRVPDIEACAPVQEKCSSFMDQEAPQQ